MPRQVLYSHPSRPSHASRPDPAAVPGPTPDRPHTPPSRWSRVRPHLSPHNIYLLWGFVGVLALLLATSLALPLRPGALAALTAGDFDKRTAELTIGKDKTGKPRRIQLPKEAAKLLADQAKDKLPGVLVVLITLPTLILGIAFNELTAWALSVAS